MAASALARRRMLLLVLLPFPPLLMLLMHAPQLKRGNSASHFSHVQARLGNRVLSKVATQGSQGNAFTAKSILEQSTVNVEQSLKNVSEDTSEERAQPHADGLLSSGQEGQAPVEPRAPHDARGVARVEASSPPPPTETSSRDLATPKASQVTTCAGSENTELWGTVVLWGKDLIVESTAECCAACRMYEPSLDSNDGAPCNT
eukprot:678736-Pleurochrysis_carterae.AAC.2